jgi:hypothetical protein
MAAGGTLAPSSSKSRPGPAACGGGMRTCRGRARRAGRRRELAKRGVSLGDVTFDKNAQLASVTDPVGSVITFIENPSI